MSENISSKIGGVFGESIREEKQVVEFVKPQEMNSGRSEATTPSEIPQTGLQNEVV